MRDFAVATAWVAAGLLLASGAWGQAPVLRQVTSDAALVAWEHFGGEPRLVQASEFDLDDVAAGDQRPYVGLNVDGAAIGAGSVAEITFTLDGATFEQTVGPSHLDQRQTGDCSGARVDGLASSVASGGARGESSVTFRAEVRDAGGAGLAVGQSVCFWLPDLSAALANVSEAGAERPAMGVNVTAGIRSVRSIGAGFPAAINGNNVDAAGMPTPNNESGSPGPVTRKTLFRAVPALAASLGTGATGYVILSDRTRIAFGGEPDPSRKTQRTGLRIGTLSVGPSEEAKAGRIWKLDGSGRLDDDAVDATLSGSVALKVAGLFQDGDKVVVGTGRAALEGTPSEGMAEVRAPLGVIDGLPVVYLPGGTDDLRPGAFTLAAVYLFNDPRNRRNAMILPMSTGLIEYIGVSVQGYAYGLFAGGGTDVSFLRVTCEDRADCELFLDCRSADNVDHFSPKLDVPAGATAVWSSDAIAGMLGGGWTSETGHCDIHSTGELAVQHMVRSGGRLHNHSVVIGRSLDDDAMAGIKAALDDICASVGSADPDGDPSTDDRTPCVPMEAAP